MCLPKIVNGIENYCMILYKKKKKRPMEIFNKIWMIKNSLSRPQNILETQPNLIIKIYLTLDL